MATNDFLDHNEKLRLLTALRNMTQHRQIVWQDPSRSRKDYERVDTFLATIENNFGFLLSSIDRDGVAPYKLDISKRSREKTGDIEDIASIEMRPLDEGGDEEVNRLLSSLYAEVVRRVRRPDEIISDLFEAIDRIEPESPF